MPFYERNTTSINYEVWEPTSGVSSGTITLVNGHTRSLSDFKMMGRALVGAGYKVVVLDNRGAGKTKSGIEFTLDEMVEDVVGLWGSLGIPRSNLLGISMGGFIAQVLACRFPELVEKLILVSTSPSRTHLKNGEQGWVTDAAGIDEKMASYFTPDFISRNRLLFDSMVKQTLKAVSDGDFLDRAEAQRRAVQLFDPPRVESITAMTLVIHGDHDVTVDVEGGRELARRIPNARLSVVSQAGHLLLAEKPKELYDKVIEFLSSSK